jgi:predicted porin
MRFTISAVAAVVLQATSGSACTTSNEANTDCEPITDENFGSIRQSGSAMDDFSLDGLRWGSAGRDKWGDIDDW